MKDEHMLFSFVLELNPHANTRLFIEQMLETAEKFGKAVCYVIKGPGEQYEQLCLLDRMSWDDQRKEFGKVVRAIRERFNIQVIQLAKSINMAPSVIVKLENGNGPKMRKNVAEIIRKIIKALPPDQTKKLREMYEEVFEK